MVSLCTYSCITYLFLFFEIHLLGTLNEKCLTILLSFLFLLPALGAGCWREVVVLRISGDPLFCRQGLRLSAIWLL